MLKKKIVNLYFYSNDLGSLCGFYWALKQNKIYGRYKIDLKKYDLKNNKYRVIMPVYFYTRIGLKLIKIARDGIVFSYKEEYHIY